MGEQPERRRAVRVRSLNFVNVEPGQEVAIHSLGRTLELNIEGATIELADPLPVGSRIKLELAMGDVITPLTGDVINCQHTPSGLYRIGVQFHKPSTIFIDQEA